MNWNNYQRSFKISCSLRKIPEEHQKVLLSYAFCLNSKSLPIIYSVDHLSKLLGYEEGLLYAIRTFPHRYYHNPIRNHNQKKNLKNHQKNHLHLY